MIWFVVGLYVGVFAGIFITSMCVMARSED